MMIKTRPGNNDIKNGPHIAGRRKSSVTKLSAIPSNRYKRPLYTRRGQARTYRKSRIRFAEYNANRFHNALMLNNSTDGMYFETDVQLLPGSLIHVNVIPSPVMEAWSPSNIYTAEVRWCRPINADRCPRFGIGVRFCPPVTQ